MRINVPIASAMSRLQLSRRHQLDASDVPLSDDRALSRRVTRPFTDDCLATCVRQTKPTSILQVGRFRSVLVV